jgi:hypothetical protein
MSEEKRLQVARKYVDKQLKAMKKRSAKKISRHDYNSLVRQVAQTVQRY